MVNGDEKEMFFRRVDLMANLQSVQRLPIIFGFISQKEGLK
jgi:hypothetical protein